MICSHQDLLRGLRGQGRHRPSPTGADDATAQDAAPRTREASRWSTMWLSILRDCDRGGALSACLHPTGVEQGIRKVAACAAGPREWPSRPQTVVLRDRRAQSGKLLSEAPREAEQVDDLPTQVLLRECGAGREPTTLRPLQVAGSQATHGATGAEVGGRADCSLRSFGTDGGSRGGRSPELPRESRQMAVPSAAGEPSGKPGKVESVGCSDKRRRREKPPVLEHPAREVDHANSEVCESNR